jgi:methane monooxygenase component A beta chain/propane monooxygenase small subunit
MSAAAPPRAAAKTARDFTFITPQLRRLTEYEALTVHQQPDPLDFDRPHGNLDITEWYLLRPDGSPLWSPESTRLRHADWFAYRDPAQQWQRTYVRQQEQQETSIERVTEDAGLDGALGQLDPRWITDILCSHYRAWSFFDYAIFRALAPAQREALSDTLGNLLCFQSFDHLRHAQDVVIYLVELENYNPAVNDAAGKDTWLNSPNYQPARRLAEQIMGTTDWGELMLGLNLVVAPLLQQSAVSDLVRRNALPNNDPVASHIVMTAERDRRRNLAATQAFVRMVVDPASAHADFNRAVIQHWLDDWTLRTEAAVSALAPVFDAPPVRSIDFSTSRATASATTARLIRELGFATALGDRQ